MGVSSIQARFASPHAGGLSGEENIGTAEPQEQGPTPAQGEGAPRESGTLVASGAAPVHRRAGALRDRRPPGRDPLWRYRRDASAGDQAGPAETDRPAPAPVEGALALSRVGPRAESGLQRPHLFARRHRLFVDPPFRPLGATGRLPLRHGLQRDPAPPRRGARGGVLAALPAPLEGGDAERATARPGAVSAARERAPGQGARIRQRPAQLRRRGRVRLPAAGLPAPLPGRGAAQEPQPDERRADPVRRDPLLLLTSPRAPT